MTPQETAKAQRGEIVEYMRRQARRHKNASERSEKKMWKRVHRLVYKELTQHADAIERGDVSPPSRQRTP